ncbi:MAG: type I-MYXAN CRISPR-associated protein Cas6/Cmx6 [Pirellulaceae bacterium]|nr:MAG: type I-MYXAN CRISPR-associated protein Cas6/Cmx6 [Pirellulaceae bacterium]
MEIVEILFPVIATKTIPADHGYQLFAALSRIVPQIHDDNRIGICPITGRLVAERRLTLTPQSRLRLRTDASLVPTYVSLAGRQIRLGDAIMSIGVPFVQALMPADVLRSRLVVIKIKDVPSAADLSPELFQRAARRQLESLGIRSDVGLTVGKRRTLRIRQREIVGYELTVRGLGAEESLALQSYGMGGRRHMGCGVFVPVRQRGAGNEPSRTL